MAFGFLATLSQPVLADTTLRLATWNIAHLYEEYSGRFERFERDEADFERLRNYAEALNADIVALQEVENADVARRVFGDGYDFYFTQRNNRQRVGLAVRKGVALVGTPEDYEELGLDGGHLRFGLDATVAAQGQTLRLLAVHLKSFCHADPLDGGDDDCGRLAAQVPVLERWIEDRVVENQPMAVLGDFNRRFDVEGGEAGSAWMWPQLSDGDPNDQRLVRVTRSRIAECWDRRWPHFIDHIVFDERAAAWIDIGSFRQVVYDAPEDEMAKLSDHCPISVDITIPAPPS
jgi:endonuclease/exonuclease/phosphatase family metal-dependent hydrolase